MIYIKWRKSISEKYKDAAILMIIHGGFMEIGSCLTLPVLFMGLDKTDMSSYFSFIVPYLQDNLDLMIIMGGIYGVVRIIGAIGLLKNRMWGISIINH